MDWANRIVGHGVKPAGEFLAHPSNWRIHPSGQQAVLEEVLTTVGWVQGVIENVRTGHLLDGHQRVLSGLKHGEETPIPFTQVDVSEEEEALILATLDPISAMAAADRAIFQRLIADIDGVPANTQALLDEWAGTLSSPETPPVEGFAEGAQFHDSETVSIDFSVPETRWTDTIHDAFHDWAEANGVEYKVRRRE